MADAPYGFRAEPSGPTYERLVRLAPTYCTQALLVVRDEGGMSEALATVLRDLAAQSRRASSWPGTRLIGADATVYEAPLSPANVAILCAAGDRLYGWLQPDLPEDLCFLRADGSAWLTSIAHEGDAFLTMRPHEAADVALRDPLFWSELEAEDDAAEG
jgi:hypothetical protein